MGSKIDVRYRLPRTQVVISGAIKRTFDQDMDSGKTLATMPAALVAHSVELRTLGEQRYRTVEVKGGWLREYKASFSQTDDLRLTKASSETTGTVDTLISAAAKIGGTVASIAAAALAEAPDASRASYAEKYANESAEQARLVAQKATVRAKINALDAAVIETPAHTAQLSPQIRQLRDIERSIIDRLTILDAHYSAWHATRITSVTDTFELVVELANVPTSIPDANDLERWGRPLVVESPDGPTTLKHLWERYGLGVFATFLRNRNKHPVEIPGGADKIVARFAEDMTLSVVECVEKIPVVSSRSRFSVGDEYSPIQTFELKKSLFGKRSIDLAFSADGFLTGVDTEGTAALSTAATALSGVPGDIATGVESYGKIATGLATAKRAGLDAELARVKAEVELRQQQILAAGLDSTTADATRLTRLTQLQGILESQAAISKIDPTLVGAARTGTTDLDWYQEPPAATPTPAAEQTLTIVLQQAGSSG